MEIQNLKQENAKLNKEKEKQRIYKDEHKINKQLQLEISKLKEENKSLKETNAIFCNQIEMLNKQIIEISNKENTSANDSLYLQATKNLFQKKLLDSSPMPVGVAGVVQAAANKSTHLADFDLNSSASILVPKSTNPESVNEQSGTPNSNANKTTTTPATPSSSLRQRQCAQQ
jgi:hypothetical protein